MSVAGTGAPKGVWGPNGDVQGKTTANGVERVSLHHATTTVDPQQPDPPGEAEPNQSGSLRLSVARIDASDKGRIAKSGKVPWRRITERLQKPTVGPKDGPAVVFSSFRDSHRCADDVLEISALALDIEAKTEGRKAVCVPPNTFFRRPVASPIIMTGPVGEEWQHGLAAAQSERVAKVGGRLAA